MIKHSKTLILVLAFLLLFPYQAFAYKIVIDPGHGGKDPGAIGVNGLQEKVVNLDIALKLRELLQQKGYEVVMTRENDRYLTLAERVVLSDAANADLFVSVHANSFKSYNRGTMVLYYDNDYPQADYPASDRMKELSAYSKKLAQQVQSSFVNTVGTIDLGLTKSAVYVTRMGSVPSILIETAFLSNKEDAAMLADDAVRKKMAVGIAEGIAAFQPPVFVDTVGHWARDSILKVKDKGLVEGVNNRYEPDRSLTRAEFLTLMDRMFNFTTLSHACSSKTVTEDTYGCKSSPTSGLNTGFTDLPTTHWAYPTFAKALELTLIEGYEDGTIHPDAPITRAEVAVLFQRLLQAESAVANVNVPAGETQASMQNQASPSFFKDVPADLWSAKAIYELAGKGIINGMTAAEFMPHRSISRAEMAAMMDRYISKP
ncbi:N-acetylmuramoyl-L-alanine amidase [Paenibacillus eucommiae]|uniref:N-acetylmuramoyl-L-alanine amidase n=1 Tax=Paenibacillus eucommiae TaxID=1355755 RepID=A0ABS4JB11_9BACL|nr:N-acetylmuramoyl-L-alanine amidase [Paenibacillus eucommiae]MBP1995924.1 N-acetylmuramoyl-L-alanine amidase [Paenibacillus eucommiae]